MMADTDAARVIYFGVPTRWTERLITDWLASVGSPVSETLAAGFGSPAVHAELTFHSPLRLDDVVAAELTCERVSRRSITYCAKFSPTVGTDAGQPAVLVRLTQVHVRSEPDGTVSAVELPARLSAALSAASCIAHEGRVPDTVD